MLKDKDGSEDSEDLTQLMLIRKELISHDSDTAKEIVEQIDTLRMIYTNQGQPAFEVTAYESFGNRYADTAKSIGLISDQKLTDVLISLERKFITIRYKSYCIHKEVLENA